MAQSVYYLNFLINDIVILISSIANQFSLVWHGF